MAAITAIGPLRRPTIIITIGTIGGIAGTTRRATATIGKGIRIATSSVARRLRVFSHLSGGIRHQSGRYGGRVRVPRWIRALVLTMLRPGADTGNDRRRTVI